MLKVKALDGKLHQKIDIGGLFFSGGGCFTVECCVSIDFVLCMHVCNQH